MSQPTPKPFNKFHAMRQMMAHIGDFITRQTLEANITELAEWYADQHGDLTWLDEDHEVFDAAAEVGWTWASLSDDHKWEIIRGDFEWKNPLLTGAKR